MPESRSARAEPAARPSRAGRRWLLFVHQLPTTPSNLRVRTWRRLQQLGAVAVKQAVYILPDSANAREDFEWLKTEVEAGGGEATVFAADSVDAWTDDRLVEEFRRARQTSYAELADEIESLLARAGRARQPRGSRAVALSRRLGDFQQRLGAIESIDFFGSAGRDRVKTLLDRLADRVAGPRRPDGARPPPASNVTAYRGRLWVTRPRPGVDRMASAWLIRRFIDRDARFAFAADRDHVPADGIPFDMFGVELTHQADGCTFETLCTTFGLAEPAIARLAAIVHDVDLKDERFRPPEAPTVAAAIEGLQLAHADDDVLLAQGMGLFDALYRSFERAERAAGPRPLAKPRRAAASRREKTGRGRRR